MKRSKKVLDTTIRSSIYNTINQGLSQRQISHRLGISQGTVENSSKKRVMYEGDSSSRKRIRSAKWPVLDEQLVKRAC